MIKTTFSPVRHSQQHVKCIKYVCARVRAFARRYVRMCVRMCVRARVCVCIMRQSCQKLTGITGWCTFYV